jgi:hypothetical protein
VKIAETSVKDVVNYVYSCPKILKLVETAYSYITAIGTLRDFVAIMILLCEDAMPLVLGISALKSDLRRTLGLHLDYFVHFIGFVLIWIEYCRDELSDAEFNIHYIVIEFVIIKAEARDCIKGV